MKLLAFCLLLALSRAQDKNILDLAKDLGANELTEKIKTAILESTFTGSDNYTVFAPTDDAFANLDEATKTKINGDNQELAKLLKYHVVSGNVKSSDLKNDQLVDTLEPSKIRTNVYTVGDKKVITATGGKVTSADNIATNGVIHIVDKVLIPPSETVTEYVTSDLSKLLELVTTAELGDTLKGDGPFTLFAPNDEAINKQNLTDLKADKEKLKKVLLNHVVNETYYSAALSDKKEMTAMGGNTIKVKISGGETKFNEGKLLTADLSMTNGVIHIIDAMMLEKVEPEPNPSDASTSAPCVVLASLAGLFAILLTRN
jgi:transforming growth factor-beta-induced protein